MSITLSVNPAAVRPTSIGRVVSAWGWGEGGGERDDRSNSVKSEDDPARNRGWGRGPLACVCTPGRR